MGLDRHLLVLDRSIDRTVGIAPVADPTLLVVSCFECITARVGDLRRESDLNRICRQIRI